MEVDSHFIKFVFRDRRSRFLSCLEERYIFVSLVHISLPSLLFIKLTNILNLVIFIAHHVLAGSFRHILLPESTAH